ncbi:hypothetical protein D1J36_005225 [Riemerella anatipestifer]|uniref:hypothetical protein n=1 Tax=Riemerella anatipestifer TaxID=34085 RepID=UPI0012AD6352|nr:hypothetical protein [Riemerella anatipestifer]USL94712.1 hypothetical protein D1J36_005225 [Riemerella anatipestifer]
MKILLILSFILFQLPLAFYGDTMRRLNRMKYYNALKADNYIFENGDISENKYMSLNLLSSWILSLFPLIGGLNIHWLLAIVIAVISSQLIVPFIAFSLYPFNTIYSIRKLKLIATIYPILGFILYFIAK